MKKTTSQIIEEFNRKYKQLGGFDRLRRFYEEGKTREFVANYFGVTPYAVTLWFKKIYGMGWDTRQVRKNRSLSFMVEMASKMTEKEWHEAFRESNYIDEALGMIYSAGIKFK